LRRWGAEIVFFSKPLPDWLTGELQTDGFRLVLLDGDADEGECMARELMRMSESPFDWLVVDHYGWGVRQEAAIARFCRRVMVIDDLADRSRHCDLLLNQNDVSRLHERYLGLVPPSARLLLGSRYALLREEFVTTRALLNRQMGPVRTLFVSFGGSDPTNETDKVLNALDDDEFADLNIHVVIGRLHPAIDRIMQKCQCDPRIQLHIQSNQVARLMAESDLAICAGGAMTWERYCMGLPGLTIAVGDNQMEVAKFGQESGVDWYLGKSGQVEVEQIQSTLQEVLNDPDRLHTAQQAAFAKVDGRGADRVTEVMMKEIGCG
jgi:UDP-2,4-diacetamido-2,4,6-trideoxy-beta-L-altropyranose hydrolase